MIIAKYLHILGFTVWVGGMFFAYMTLRPIAGSRLDVPQRLRLWEGVFGKFFPWVWVSVGLILASGLYMMYLLGRPPLYVFGMTALGLTMIAIFLHIVFAPYRRLREAVAAQDWKSGGAALGRIRRMVGFNLILGLLTITVGALGPLVG